MGARVRQADIAARAGVSVPVVSRALSGHADVSARTRAHVLRIAQELGYVRAAQPRGRPASFRSTLIELAMGGFDDPWSTEVAGAIRRAADERGWDLVLVAEREAPADDWTERVRQRRSLGVIAAVVAPTRVQSSALRAAGIPLVLLDPRADPAPEATFVSADNHAGGAQAAAHLLALGHRDFLIVTGAPPFRYGRARERGFRKTVDAVPGTRTRSVGVAWNARDAHQAIMPVLTDPARTVTAVFCVADSLAAGVLRATASVGVRVPEELSVVGFDDVPASRRLAPPLTTVRQPIREMAVAAASLLADMIVTGTLTAPARQMPTELIVRRSTAVPSDGSRVPDHRE